MTTQAFSRKTMIRNQYGRAIMNASPDTTTAHTRLKEAAAAYAAEARTAAPNLRAAFDRLKQDPVEPEPLTKLCGLAHRYAGSGLTMGFPEISRAAEPLEAMLQTLKQAGAAPDSAHLAQIGLLTTALANRLATLPEATTTTGNVTGTGTEAAAGPDGDGDRDLARILLLDRPQSGQPLLADHLSVFGIDLNHATSASQARELCAKHRFDAAVLVDPDTPPGGSWTIDACRTLRETLPDGAPLVIGTDASNSRTRMASIAAGASHVLDRPPVAADILQAIRLGRRQGPEDPYRILLVGADSVLNAAIRASLADDLMHLEIAESLDAAPEIADSLRPEVVILDLHDMPRNDQTPTVAAFAAGLRDSPGAISPAILQICRETVAETGTGDGGSGLVSSLDAVLPIPMRAETMHDIVFNTGRRIRTITDLIARDMLTGVWTQRPTLEHLEREVLRASRHGLILTVALAEIDDLHGIGARAGLGATDQVMQSLARYFVKRLRRDDAIGRYGATAFLVVLPHTDLTRATGVFEDLRQRFAQMDHVFDGASVRAGFRFGLASCPPESGVPGLLAAATNALRASGSAATGP